MILAFIYCSIAVIFAVPTILEGNTKKLGWGFYRFAGLVACAAWPIFLIAVAMSGLRRRPPEWADDGL